MKRTYILTVLIFSMLIALTSSGQITAPFAVGLRGSPDGCGLNLRYFFNENFALEGQGNYSGGNLNGSGPSKMGVLLAEYHFIFPDPSWRIFMGGGVHYGTWQRYADRSTPEGLFGLDVILGAEYVFTHVPIGISADVKPSFNYVSNITGFPNNTFGLSARFYFGKWEEYETNEVDDRE